MIQKKIVRIMTFSKYSEESRPLFLSLKIHNIYELIIYQMALFMNTYFNDNLPSYFTNYFKIQSKILFSCSGNMILKNNKIFPDSERNKNLKTVEVEYFVRTNRTSSATVEM